MKKIACFYFMIWLVSGLVVIFLAACVDHKMPVGQYEEYYNSHYPKLKQTDSEHPRIPDYAK